MSGYEVLELGTLDAWGDKRFVDRAIGTQYIGVSATAFAPGTGSAIWHAHSVLEEIYVFLDGEGQMALDGDVVDVRAGTTIRVGQDVMRAIHANADSPTDLRYLCIRAGNGELKDQPKDGARSDEPFPWA